MSTVVAAPAARQRQLAVVLPDLIFPAGVFIAVASLAAASGGYFPTSWGWSGLAFFWAAAAALILRTSTTISRLELTFLGLVTALVGWTWLSTLWSLDVGSSVLEGQRGLVLIGAVAAALALAPARPVRPLLGAVLAATTLVCSYGLATRLFPDQVGSYDSLAVYRLNTPIGYWNGLGVFAALGAVLALGLAARGVRPATRGLAAASLLVLVPTLYFTFGRSAWLSVLIGLVVLFALDPRRLQLAATSLCVLPWPAIAVGVASRSHALTRQSSILPDATHDGRRLALVLVGLALGSAVTAVTAQLVGRRFTFGRMMRVAFAAVLVAAVAATFVVGIAKYSSPPTIARHAYDSFTSPPTRTTNLNARLFSLSSNNRTVLWKVEWQQVKAHPLIGSGAGSYARYYLAHRHTTLSVQDGHSLYLETLAELGPLALALLAAMLALPLVAAVRLRRHPLVPIACAAYVVYLVHAAADWDWELAGVTLAALFCGLACILAAREEREPRQLSPRGRLALGSAVTALGIVALLGLIGNLALAANDTAAQNGNWPSAERHAHTAIRWMPWSALGWQRLGEAQLGLHDRPAARQSLERAVAKDPNSWIAWLDLAVASRADRQLDALVKASSLNPLSPEIPPIFEAALHP
jgi:hypothetical protein